MRGNIQTLRKGELVRLHRPRRCNSHNGKHIVKRSMRMVRTSLKGIMNFSGMVEMREVVDA